MVEDKNVSSGNTFMLSLQLLSRRDMYGYKMIETLQKWSESMFNSKADAMYPFFHTMEAKRPLVSYEKEAQGKVRGYYSITKEGRSILAKKKEDWNTYSGAVEHVIGGALYGNTRISRSFNRADQE